MTVAVKVCGLRTPDAVAAALNGAARYVGFVFFPRSPRALSPIEAAPLVNMVPEGVGRVAVVVDADDRALDAILTAARFDYLQCHGRETVARVTGIRDRFNISVIKAVPVGNATDVAAAVPYEEAADRLLFDSRPPAQASRPGGNALTFDWPLLRTRAWRRPWFLAGGLNEGNLEEAVRASGADAVDVSSGVESAPGEKSIRKIEQFLALARDL